ncbi:MAG: L-threonylcarbamoyladenylate synthase [Candidatus Aminicenantales bacterium]
MPIRAVRVDLKKYDPKLVRSVRNEIRAGAIVIFPTETYYGLGANAFLPAAVKRIYDLKKRDQGKPLPIVAADMEAATSYAEHLPRAFYELARQFWPGPLTFIVRSRPLFPAEMLGSGNTIALRVPGNSWLRSFLADLGVPLTATSANRSGEAEVADPFKIQRDFVDDDVIILDGGRTPGGLCSTILDLTGDRPKIIREGVIPVECLSPYLV